MNTGARAVAAMAALATFAMLAGACQKQGAVQEDAFGTIPPERKALWEKSFNAGDVATVAGLYAEDATLVMTGAEPVVGREAIRQALAGMAASGAKIELKTLRSVASGGVGYNYGSYVVRGPDAAELERGHFAEIWERPNGEWLITVDANSTSAPPAAAPAAADAPAPAAAAAADAPQ